MMGPAAQQRTPLHMTHACTLESSRQVMTGARPLAHALALALAAVGVSLAQEPPAAAARAQPPHVPAECGDLSGVWRHATVNPSAQYIASVTKGSLNRWAVAKASSGAGQYTVTCRSGACAGKNATSALSVVTSPSLNGSVTLSGSVPMAMPAAPRVAAGKCASLEGSAWCLGRDCGEKYTIAEQARAPAAGRGAAVAFNVTCVKGPGSRCSSWQSATGALDTALQRVSVTFNTGGGQSGQLDPDCKRVYWCKAGSACGNFWCGRGDCRKPPPPPPAPTRGVLSVKDRCHAIFWRDADGTDGGTKGGPVNCPSRIRPAFPVLAGVCGKLQQTDSTCSARHRQADRRRFTNISPHRPAWYREVAHPPANVSVHIVPHSRVAGGAVADAGVLGARGRLRTKHDQRLLLCRSCRPV